MSRVRAFFLCSLGLIVFATASSVSADEDSAARRVAKDRDEGTQELPDKEKDANANANQALQRLHEQVTVVGDASQVHRIPGSAYVIDPKELDLQKQGFDDIHRFLRQVPGVSVQEEEGYGLRPNIGMRGSGTERSSKITLMEDGVLIAPAPYAAPAAYYFPIAGRMESIEVRKGSSQVKYGPRTNGGVLNLVSTSVPTDFRINATVSLGENGARKLHANVGDSYENVSWMFETYQFGTRGYKQVDGGGASGFNVQDFLGKLRFNSSATASVFQAVELKIGAQTQDSDETYLGLTDGDFAVTPLRRYAASQPDNLRWDHQQYQVQHFLATTKFDVTTTVYRNEFARNWYKLQSILGRGVSSIFGSTLESARHLEIARGATSAPDDLKVRANNRDYYGMGIQSALGFKLKTASTAHDLELGVRYHEDQEDRLQFEDGFQMFNGRMLQTSSGAPGSQSNRLSEANAVALFVQDEVSWRRLSVLPGLRYENIELTRFDFSTSDPVRVAGPSRVRTNSLDVLVPGLGVRFAASDQLQLFGGIHKGFGPPGPGSNEETEAEKSINYELGIREQARALSAELVVFFNDYSNLLGADTLSAGGTGEGALFNGGDVNVFGVEASIAYDFAERLELPFSLPVRGVYSYTDAEFQNAFQSDFESWGSVTPGDKMPYLAPHQLYLSVSADTDTFRVGVNGSYTSRMRIRAGQGEFGDAEATDSHFVLNAFFEYDLAKQATAFVNVQNLGDESYIAARRPAGARPGLPRTFMAGIKFRLGS